MVVELELNPAVLDSCHVNSTQVGPYSLGYAVVMPCWLRGRLLPDMYYLVGSNTSKTFYSYKKYRISYVIYYKYSSDDVV